MNSTTVIQFEGLQFGLIMCSDTFDGDLEVTYYTGQREGLGYFSFSLECEE